MTSRSTTAIAIAARNLPAERIAVLRAFVLVSLVLVLVLITNGGAG